MGLFPARIDAETIPCCLGNQNSIIAHPRSHLAMRTQMLHSPPPFPPNEDERALSLEHLEVLDSAPEKEFDDIVMLASTWCEVPVALVSLVDRERQWFKACVGLDESPRILSSTLQKRPLKGPFALKPESLG